MYAPDVEMKFADVGYWKERAFIAEQELERQKIQLRDDFAMAALPAIIAMKPNYTGNPEDSLMKCDCEAAYMYADAMLAQREVTK
jgi:hypothetical protein